MIYCLSCKKPTKDVNVKPKVTKNKRPYIIKYLSIVYTLAQSKEKETSKFHKDLLGFLGKGLSRSFNDTKVKRR